MSDPVALEPEPAPRYPARAGGPAGDADALVAAHDPRLDRAVLVKRLGGAASAGDIERFVAEARLQGRLEHPALVPVLDVALDGDGRPYFVMREVRGTALAEVLAQRAAGDRDLERRFPTRRLLAAFVEVCFAIEYAHTSGVVHHDLRPEHLLVGDFGEVYVQAWGQARSDAGDRADDVAALGRILFEILCLRPLPAGEDVHAAARAAGRHGPPELLDACAAATAADPAARPASARAIAETVQGWLDGVRDLARRRELAVRHRERARAALAEGDRITAIREAGSAVALAPHDAAAAELLGRLVLEPPPDDSAEAAAVVADSDADEVRAQARIATASFLAIPAFLLLLLWPGVRDARIPAAIAALALGEAGYAMAAARGRVGIRSWSWISLLGNVVMLMLFTRVYGPMLLVPAMAATLTLTALTVPGLRPWPLVPVLFGAGVLGPWLLEGLGVLAPTTWTTGSSVVVTSTVVALPRLPTLAVLAVHAVAVVAIATNYSRHLARLNREARLRLLSQAWHLEQIVATEQSSARWPVRDPKRPVPHSVAR